MHVVPLRARLPSVHIRSGRSAWLMSYGVQVIVDDYVQSEAVLKASRMHHELDLDGVCPPSRQSELALLH